VVVNCCSRPSTTPRLAAHQASDHYKAYQAVTKGIVLKSSTMPLSPVAMLTRQ
jgi:hypothetical protein